MEGEDDGAEAKTRMRSTGNGFEGWYGTTMHISRPDTGLPTMRTTAIPRENDDPVNKKHLFGKDHWFMGAKYPNMDTMSDQIKNKYYTVREGSAAKATQGGSA
jgi:hypothetical protein